MRIPEYRFIDKKSANISTVRATSEQKDKLQRLVKDLGFNSMAHFFTRSMETLFEQTDAGDDLTWPLRFEARKKGDSTKGNLLVAQQ